MHRFTYHNNDNVKNTCFGSCVSVNAITYSVSKLSQKLLNVFIFPPSYPTIGTHYKIGCQNFKMAVIRRVPIFKTAFSMLLLLLDFFLVLFFGRLTLNMYKETVLNYERN